MKIKVTIVLLSMMVLCNLAQAENDGKAQRWKEAMKSSDTNITFYGIVKDQDGQPVSDATIVANLTFFSLTGEYFQDQKKIIAHTDSEGKFVFKDLRGRTLYFDVIKRDGYEFYRIQDQKYAFDFGGVEEKEKFKPDKSNPCVFILHKKPEPGYVEESCDAKSIYLTGEEFEVDLKKGISLSVKKLKAATGDMMVSVMPGLSKDRFNILIKTRKDEDLIIEQDGEAHTAPETGSYRHEIAFELKPAEEILKNIYFKGRMDNAYTYARLQLKLKLRSSGVSCGVCLYTGLDDGRNLEYDRRYTLKRKVQDVSKKIDHAPTNAQHYAERAELKLKLSEGEDALNDAKKAKQYAPKDEKINALIDRIEFAIPQIKANQRRDY